MTLWKACLAPCLALLFSCAEGENPNQPVPISSSSVDLWSSIAMSSSEIVQVSSISIESSSSIFVLSSSSYLSPWDALNTPCGTGVKPPPVDGGTSGWASRYWDCCKPHCAWTANASATFGPSAVCTINDQPLPYDGFSESTSGCDDGGNGFACGSQAPYAICDSVSYGFAAVPANDPMCGHCFQIDFDGGMKDYAPKSTHVRLKGMTMIVIASNVGGDVSTGQFDLMIPGGGLGMNTAGCGKQWGVDPNNTTLVGETYGGFSRSCEIEMNYNYTLTKMRNCVQAKCDALFAGKPQLKAQYDGCTWYAQWMNGATNPTFKYKEVVCPAELMRRFQGL